MIVSRIDIEKALDGMIANEEWLPFQRMATRLARQRWPDLLASEPKKDLGADARGSGSLATDGKEKVFACSLTLAFDKILDDATAVRTHYPNTKVFIFATPRKLSNQTASSWAKELQKLFGYELVPFSREEIVSLLMEPQNVSICRTMLHIDVEIEPDLAELIDRATLATRAMTASWFEHQHLADQPLIELRAMRLEEGDKRGEILSLTNIVDEVSDGKRLVLEAPAGRGKTTTLIQLAKRIDDANGLAFLIDLPEWAASGRTLLDYVAEMQRFRMNGITAQSLARVLYVERVSFLFNGWNELSERSAETAENSLQAVDREFPLSGVLIATRAQSTRPPFTGAFRIRLLPLTRAERSAYLAATLGQGAQELSSNLESNKALNELTGTPFILREITKIFKAGRTLPTTKMGILQSVMQLLEEAVGHANELRRTPLSGNAGAYLAALAIEMTGRGDISVSEVETRKICKGASQKLESEGQIAEVPEPSSVLDALCAHHVLERIDYPLTEFRFEHQQFQEFYAARWLDHELTAAIEGSKKDAEAFVKDYLNVTSWDEPLRMIVEKIGSDANETPANSAAIIRGKKLIEMVLTVDPIFAADLARLAGHVLWREVGGSIAQRIRAWYRVDDAKNRQCALAAMFASGSNEFGDILLPLLSSDNQQVRLATYRTWHEFHLSVLSSDWQKTIGGWTEEARKDFVSELTVMQGRTDVAEYLSLNDPSIEVRTEAVKVLEWVGSEDKLVKALESLPEPALDAALIDLDRQEIPQSMLPRVRLAYERHLRGVTNPLGRVQIRLVQMDLGETNFVDALKSELLGFPNERPDFFGETVLRQALETVQKQDKQWASEWVVSRLAAGSLRFESWKDFVVGIPETLKDQLFIKISQENLEFGERQTIQMLAAFADVSLAQKAFSELCSLRCKFNTSGFTVDQLQGAIIRQLEELFRSIPPVVAVESLSKVFSQDFDETAFGLVAELFARIGLEDSDLRSELPEDLRQELRRYLKGGLSFTVSHIDIVGRPLANLASALARVGEPEDMCDLDLLIQADLLTSH